LRKPGIAWHVGCRQNFVAAFRFLAGTPGAGHRREDLLEDRPLLVWPMCDYLIFYKFQSDPLQIVAIMRGSQDIPGIVARRQL
jgi:plasmid stabilization system protein ParE